MSPIKTHVTIRDEFCIETKAQPCAIIIFGASGDLTSRKLIPALFNLYRRKLLPDKFYVVGCARTQISDELFRQKVMDYVSGLPVEGDIGNLDKFLERFYFVSGDYQSAGLYRSLSEKLVFLDRQYSTSGNHIFYLSTPPGVYGNIVKNLADGGLVTESGIKSPWTRVVIEKPFGFDLQSAIDLDNSFNRVLNEEQIYRIDHYLGKDTVQNILIFRFANSIFEPIWNRHYIDHVQITVAESIGVEHRAGYYEQAGLLRDMFQNHMLQMLALVAMEAPVSFDANHVRNEKVKLLQSVRPFKPGEIDKFVVRGQYAGSEKQSHVAYREEHGVNPQSSAETFVAAKMFVDNWRWQGVPFYLRSGKRLKKKISEIAIVFKNVPYSIFAPIASNELLQNILVLNVQPEEGMSLTLQAKHPGPKLCMSSLTMDFSYQEIFGEVPPDSYQRLLLDSMLGDQTLFIRHDDMKVAWSLITPVLKHWQSDAKAESLYFYNCGTWGPTQADALINRDGKEWRDIP